MGSGKISKTKIAKLCVASGLKFNPNRQTMKDGKRLFLISKGNDFFGFPSLGELQNWLFNQLNARHNSVTQLIDKNSREKDPEFGSTVTTATGPTDESGSL